MFASKMSLIWFLAYWACVMAVALLPSKYRYRQIDKSRWPPVREPKPGWSFPLKDKVAVILVAIPLMALSAWLWNEITAFMGPVLNFVYGTIVLKGIVIWIYLTTCYAVMIAPFWAVLITWGMVFIFVFLPGKLIYKTGRAISSHFDQKGLLGPDIEDVC
jgi:hypothetical protein